MFAPANETHFALTIEGLSADFQVFTLTGREAIRAVCLRGGAGQ